MRDKRVALRGGALARGSGQSINILPDVCESTPHQINSVGLASNLLLGSRLVAGTYSQKGSVRMGRLCCGVHSKDNRSGQELVEGVTPGKICLDAEAQPRAIDAAPLLLELTTILRRHDTTTPTANDSGHRRSSAA